MSDALERWFHPRPGWLSLGLLTIMTLAIAWSVQAAAWLDRLDFLVPVGVAAVVAGAFIGLSGVTIVVGLPLGAVIGTAVVLWAIGGEYHPDLGQLERLFALRDEAIGWTITVLRTGYPAEMSPYAIGLATLLWATAFVAAYAVYRHHRVLDAIILLGAAMLTNMSATLTDLLGHLLLFVAAALLLWLRAALVDRQDGWQRRRVSEELEVPSSIMRTGIVFATGSIVLAYVLTGVAIASPLTGAWRSLDGVWEEVRDRFDGVFGSLENPQSRISGNTFGRGFTVFGEWVSREEEAALLSAPRALYLRAATYDVYTGLGWEYSDGAKRRVEAGDLLFPGPTPERPTRAEAVVVTPIAVEMRQSIGRTMLTGPSPLRIFAPASVLESDGQPVIGEIEAANPIGEGESYEMLVAISRATEAQLQAAGEEYPEAVRALYMDASAATDRVRELAQRVVAEAGAETPYDKAKALARYLRSDEFTYDTIGPGVPAGGDLVDTFLFGENAKRGYCQYFASAMAVMARSVGLPARVAVGFAPGERTGENLYLVRESNAHAWAEVYFPGYGWEIFEATPAVSPVFRARGDTAQVEPGAPGLGFDPLAGEDWRQFGDDNPFEALPSTNPIPGAVDPRAGEDQMPIDDEAATARTNNALLIGGLILVALVVIWLRVRQLDARWRMLPAGERTWRSLTAAAGRAGIGPRPSETIYEYAGWLEEQLPAHREPISTVAHGKVWQSYSGRRISAPAAAKIEEAWRALRLPLLWLAIRRGVRRLLRRDVD